MAKSPEENNAEFAEAFNACDGEALLALYDPEARFVMPTGDVLEGVEAIGQALGGFFALKPRIDLRAERVLRCGDTAIANSSWTVTGTAPDSAPALPAASWRSRRTAGAMPKWLPPGAPSGSAEGVENLAELAPGSTVARMPG